MIGPDGVSGLAASASTAQRGGAARTPNPGTDTNELTAVSASSAHDLWAVGWWSDDKADVKTLVLHYDGTRWSRIRSPNAGPGQNELSGVSAVSATDAWAVGGRRDASSHVVSTLILHWDGSAWTRVPSPNPSATDNELIGLSAVSASNAWAVGSYQIGNAHKTLVLHWNGATWSQVPSPNPNPTAVGTNELFDVSALSATSAWAVGDAIGSQSQEWETVALQWKGAKWKRVPSPGGAFAGDDHLHGVAAVDASHAWAVGYYASFGSGNLYTLILRWNGTRWSTVTSPTSGPASILHSVSASSRTDAWAVGLTYPRTCCSIPIIDRWRGSRWSLLPSPHPGSNGILRGVASLSTTNAWAVGSYRNTSTHVTDTLVLHWNGTRWSRA